MQADRGAKREDRDRTSNATKHAHETRDRLPIRQSTSVGSIRPTLYEVFERLTCHEPHPLPDPALTKEVYF
jgi:hypothetical protein